jgi:hypothetical protein
MVLRRIIRFKMGEEIRVTKFFITLETNYSFGYALYYFALVTRLGPGVY